METNITPAVNNRPQQAINTVIVNNLIPQQGQYIVHQPHPQQVRVVPNVHPFLIANQQPFTIIRQAPLPVQN